MNENKNKPNETLLAYHFKSISLFLIYALGIASILFYPTTKSAIVLVEIFFAVTFLCITMAISKSKYRVGVAAYFKTILIFALNNILLLLTASRFLKNELFPAPITILASAVIIGYTMVFSYELAVKWMKQIKEQHSQFKDEE